MEAGGENVGEQREIPDLRHGLFFIGKLEEVEIGIGNHNVFGLSTDPAPHIDIAIRRTRPRGIDGKANPGLALAAVPAAAAGDVEWHSDEITDIQHLHIGPLRDDLTRDFVAQNQPCRGRGPPAYHMLVGPADVGSHDLQNHPMRGLFAPEWIGLTFGHPQLRIRDRLYLNRARLDVGLPRDWSPCWTPPSVPHTTLWKQMLRLSSL